MLSESIPETGIEMIAWKSMYPPGNLDICFLNRDPLAARSKTAGASYPIGSE
jgi:hypothetical protein